MSHLTSELQVKFTSFLTTPPLITNISLFFLLRISSSVEAEYNELLNTGQTQQLIYFNVFSYNEKKNGTVSIPVCIVIM